MHVHPLRATCGVVAISIAVAAGISGCGSSAAEPAASSSAADPKLAGQVPAEIRKRGTVIAGTDATYAPDEFIADDGKTVVGMSADLAAALSSVLGVRIVMKNAAFDSILPGVATGRYDIVLSSVTDTKERQASLDFVDYFSAGTSFYTRAQGGAAITGLDDLCGHRVAAEKGTTQQADLEKAAAKCDRAGKPKLTPEIFPDQNGVNLALSSQRADAAMADSPVASYQVKQSDGAFKLVGETYGTAPYGIGVKKGSALVKPLRAAMQKLIDDGSYAKIVARWGNQRGAIKRVTINGG